MQLKNIVVLLILISGQVTMRAQFHEFNAGLGFAYYYGDLNRANSDQTALTALSEGSNIKSYRMSYSLGYRHHFKNYLSVGISYSYLNIAGYDSDNEVKSTGDQAWFRKIRNLGFFSEIHVLHVDARYEPLRTQKRWDNGKWLFSPYIMGGYGIFKFSPKAMYNGREIELQPLGTEGQGLPYRPGRYSLIQTIIPTGIGFTIYHPKRKYSIGMNIVYHWTQTDYLDDVSKVYIDPNEFNHFYGSTSETAQWAIALANRNTNIENAGITSPGQIRGNPDNNDHFMTGQVKFSYYIPFREKPTSTPPISK